MPPAYAVVKTSSGPVYDGVVCRYAGVIQAELTALPGPNPSPKYIMESKSMATFRSGSRFMFMTRSRSKACNWIYVPIQLHNNFQVQGKPKSRSESRPRARSRYKSTFRAQVKVFEIQVEIQVPVLVLVLNQGSPFVARNQNLSHYGAEALNRQTGTFQFFANDSSRENHWRSRRIIKNFIQYRHSWKPGASRPSGAAKRAGIRVFVSARPCREPCAGRVAARSKNRRLRTFRGVRLEYSRNQAPLVITIVYSWWSTEFSTLRFSMQIL